MVSLKLMFVTLNEEHLSHYQSFSTIYWSVGFTADLISFMCCAVVHRLWSSNTNTQMHHIHPDFNLIWICFHFTPLLTTGRHKAYHRPVVFGQLWSDSLLYEELWGNRRFAQPRGVFLLLLKFITKIICQIYEKEDDTRPMSFYSQKNLMSVHFRRAALFLSFYPTSSHIPSSSVMSLASTAHKVIKYWLGQWTCHFLDFSTAAYSLFYIKMWERGAEPRGKTMVSFISAHWWFFRDSNKV